MLLGKLSKEGNYLLKKLSSELKDVICNATITYK